MQVSPEGPSVLDLYEARIAAGTVQRDRAQSAVLPEFERLRSALVAPMRKGLFRRSPDPVRGLYLWGGVGRGKSMLMDLFVETLGDVPARRVHFHAFMQEIHAAMHAARQRGVDDAIAPVAAEVVKTVRLLAFDEMQITDITDAMIVGRLLEALFAGGVTVVTTSNRPPDDLYKDGLNRQLFVPFIELIKERMVIWEVTGAEDHRRNRLEGEAVYFTPLGPAARARMDRVWQDLAGGAGSALVLTVAGRSVTIPAVRNGVGRARFYELCGHALGPADYLAIASALRVLLLDDIPRLSRSNFNEAKRFVTLVDTLYEAKVRLICSAAAEPEMLYVEGEGAFEFARTASRLREMLSDGWGG